MSYESRCYVVYGIGFQPLKIKGLSNKNTLVKSLEAKGFHPHSAQLNPDSRSGKLCTTIPTKY